MQKENILITGATGFIGFHLAKALAQNDKYKIIAVIRAENDQVKVKKLKQLNVRLIEGCFYDTVCLGNIFDRLNIDYVIHCAALTGAGLADDAQYQKINVLGTEVLLKNALTKNVKKFIFCSSVGVWGTIPLTVPAILKTPLNPDGSYHKSKADAEAKVLEYVDKGLNAFIIRPSIVYGPGDKGFSRKLADMVKQNRLFFKKDVLIHLINIDKLVEIFCKIIEKNEIMPRIFVAVDRTEISLRQIVDLLSMHFHQKNYPKYCMFPGWVFNCAKWFFKLLNNDKWVTRIRLLSEDWFYDGSAVKEVLGVDSILTNDYFIKQVLISE